VGLVGLGLPIRETGAQLTPLWLAFDASAEPALLGHSGGLLIRWAEGDGVPWRYTCYDATGDAAYGAITSPGHAVVAGLEGVRTATDNACLWHEISGIADTAVVVGMAQDPIHRSRLSLALHREAGPDVIAVSYDGGVTSDYSEYPVIADGHLEGMTGYSDGLVGIGTRANGTIPTLWVFSASDQGVQEVPLTSKLLSDGKELGLCASDAEDVWATTPDALLRIRLDTGDVVVERSWEQPRDDLRVGCALLEDGSLVVLEGDQVLRRDDDMTWSEFFSGRATTVYDQAGSYWVTTIAEKIGDTVIWHRSHGEPTWAPFLQADAAFEYPSACGASHAQLCGDAREAMELALGVGQPEDALGEYPDTVTARQVGCSTSGQQGPLGAGAAMGLLVFLVVTRRPAKIW